jgi:putative SOS response-associated peptidase YedK
MAVDEAPEDDDVRETYNFAPGYYGLVYRADVPDYGAGGRAHDRSNNDTAETEEGTEPQDQDATIADPSTQESIEQPDKPTRYILQPMKWGLIPFWTKRSPDYGSLLRTINCRDDSLLDNRGMWTTMKSRKRCLIICQGFYEWLKKGPSGKERVPHFVKRKDGKLMCFAGLWDCVKYEGAEEKLYTYTIITTDSNAQLKFLHDRMPVILDQGSEGITTWLDPKRSTWSKELQGLLKPFKGELECYPVNKEVGKVGNNSADFIIPVDSKENKKNIANFFANAKGKKDATKSSTKEEKADGNDSDDGERVTKEMDGERTEDNAPMPVPTRGDDDSQHTGLTKGAKRPHTPESEPGAATPTKAAKVSQASPKNEKPEPTSSPEKLKLPAKPATGGRKARNATSNETKGKGKGSPMKKTAGDGSQRITNFFVK